MLSQQQPLSDRCRPADAHGADRCCLWLVPDCPGPFGPAALRLHPSATKSPIEGLNQKGRIHSVVELPADDATTEQIDRYRQIPPGRRCADGGVVTRSAPVGSRRLEVRLLQVLHYPSSIAVGIGRRAKHLAGPGPQYGSLHEPGNAVAPDPPTLGPQLLVDPRRDVEASVVVKHRFDLSGEQDVLVSPFSRHFLPLAPGLETAAGDPQLSAKSGQRVLSSELVDQAKPLGGSCSYAKCAAASLKQSFSLLSPRFSLRSWLSSAFSLLVRRSRFLGGLTAVDAGQTQPTGQAAGGKAKPLSNGNTGETLLQAEPYGLRFLLCREPTPGSGGGGHRWTIWWS